MGHGHGHGHATAAAANRWRLAAALALMLGVAVVQVAGAATSGSLALLADAGHTVADSFGVVLALVAVWVAARPPSADRTFGLQRAEVLAAALNALTLFALCGFVAVEAVRRLLDPQPVAGPWVAAVAAVGLAANVVALLVLRGGQRDSLNVRGAYLEVMGDALASVGVLVGGGLIWLTGWERVDSLVSLAVSAFIVPRAWSLLREAVHVLLEATPRNVDLDEVRAHLMRQPGVLDVHDLHAWTITSGTPVMSAHVVVEDGRLADAGRVLDDLHACLSGHFDVEHSTLQLEPAGHVEHEGPCHA
ncbi:cation diffusion facilitator family transporter [Streptomonospora nanhaiensis]|uniref:Cobalt-zinc-cadmium efflux system protein n=1 Tax=Streptomonospora nanhaiensis TaxID=1323731 RepID=A0A853BLN8_9ACTN|nr:cation diffusion facilitator family transporter [Streptomonospora nanhaiensis]MBX9390522.1 cation diffusion facilitator family transporter [Streptomonospora nanhaiensis]NYI95614.1 cobalt-zinc-cadmium efflux system protein [Streptomonospora nanhaiensis]